MRVSIQTTKTPAVTTVLVLAFAATSALGASQGPTRSERAEYESAAGETGYRRLVTREEAGNRTSETWIVEAASINGGFDALLIVEEEVVRVDETTTRVTRQEFKSDTDGNRLLLQVVDEERVESPGGNVRVVRDISEPDLNARIEVTRRETETTTAGPNGTFETQSQVSRPGMNRRGLVSTEQSIETGRMDEDGRVLESDLTSYVDPSGRGDWEALERRITTHDYSGNEVGTVENIYRQDANGELALNEQVVSREWTDPAGRERATEDVYSTDIPGERSLREPRLLRQVAVTRAETTGGGWETTREVRESSQGRFRVVEREREIARPNSKNGLDIERVIERLDANGRFREIRSTTSTESTR